MSSWLRVGSIAALMCSLSACGATQPAAGSVTFQVISDTGPLARDQSIFAATSVEKVEAQVTASHLSETGEGHQWKIRTVPPKSVFVALIIGPQSRSLGGDLVCVETTLKSAELNGATLTFVETTRVVGPVGPCRTARADVHYSLVAVPSQPLGTGRITVVVTHQAEGIGAVTLVLPVDAQTSLLLS